MSELKELLYLVGLIPDLTPDRINDDKTNEKLNSNENYVLEGERILSLARKKRIRGPLATNNHASCITEFKYPLLEYNRRKAFTQISNTIMRTVKNHFKNISNEESLVKSGIPFLLQYSDTFDSQIIYPAVKEFSSTLAEAVCGNSLILSLNIKENIFYLPCRPVKKFRDAPYHYKKIPDRSVNMFHLEKAFYKIFLINWLNQLRMQVENSSDLYETLLYLTNDSTRIIRSYNWVYETSPLWLRLYLLENNFKEDLSSNLIINENNKEVLDYSNLKYPSILCDLRIIQYFFSNAPFLIEEMVVKETNIILLNLPPEIEYYALLVIQYMIMDIKDCKDEDNHRKNLNSLVARAYTTKKNIPLHIKEAMRNSELNEHFGFIEFDEDVDLSLVDLIIKEFKILNHNIFNDYKNKNIALRFRKLGRHHAKGLYYPSIGTMVVDFRYPDSFLHEYFHMLDDSLNNPSMNIQFSKVIERYQSLVIREANELKLKGVGPLFKKGKYNLNYYLRRCEIFARCGEIYLFRILHVVSSLLKHEDTHNFAYPEDEGLNMLIKEFYEPLLENLSDSKTIKGGENETDLCS